ncbi:MAG: hypothetical protein JXA73_15500 [Acidobacteria bacterium]|nr:hypothetical protein [Acidobacteriota bacterium]
MRITYWLLAIIFLVGVWFSENLHLFFLAHISVYKMNNANLIQVTLAILAGFFATKAADSSREIKRLLKVTEIDALLNKADEASSKSQQEQERYHNLATLVRSESKLQFARDMIINHKEQLEYHWQQILALESILEKEEIDAGIDPKVRNIIQNYIIKTRYLQYMGRNFLRNVPLIGGLLDYLFSPLWDQYYMRNLSKFQKVARGKTKVFHK